MCIHNYKPTFAHTCILLNIFSKTSIKTKIMEIVLPIPAFLHNSMLFKCSKLALNFACFHLNLLNSYILNFLNPYVFYTWF